MTVHRFIHEWGKLKQCFFSLNGSLNSGHIDFFPILIQEINCHLLMLNDTTSSHDTSNDYVLDPHHVQLRPPYTRCKRHHITQNQWDIGRPYINHQDPIHQFSNSLPITELECVDMHTEEVTVKQFMGPPIDKKTHYKPDSA